MTARRIIYTLVFLAVAVPLLLGIRARVEPSPPVKAAYDAIEALPESSLVLVGIDFGPSTMPEMNPMYEALLEHLFRRNLRVAVLSLQSALDLPNGIQVLEKVARRFGKRYGVDYANLGYKPGLEAVIVSLGQEIRDIFPEDAQGHPLDSLPMFRGVHNYNDIALVIDLASGGTYGSWIQFAQARFGVKLLVGVTAVMGPETYPYLQSRQLVGMLAGLKGAAEYETLIQRPGLASRGMPAQAVVHLLIILFILYGNWGFWKQWRR